MKFLLSFVLFISTFFFVLPVSAATIYTTDKLITVDTNRQQLTAWEGGKILKQVAVSTGLPQSPTVKGSFAIYTKLRFDDMRGVSPVKGKYYLPNVPYVMYFYQAYALHGTYWHNNFGHRMSNGCVNLRTSDAQWLYNWAPIGTRVEIW